MSNLPAKPEPGEISPRSPPQDGRHYTSRSAPMAPPSQYRREESRRKDVYIARSPPPRVRGPPAHVDSYVASDTYVAPPIYDRREDDRYRRDYVDWERRFGREYYGSAERRERSTDRRWERDDGARSWEVRHEYDRRGRGHRHSDRPPRPRDPSDRDRRWRSRASASPPRRAASRHPPERRSPGSPRRRHASPPPSHSTSPSNSRQPSPARRLRLGSHSIPSPRSPRGYSRTRTKSPEKRRRSSRSRSNSPSHRKSPRRPYTPEKRSQKDTTSDVQKARSPSLPRDPDVDLKPQCQSLSRSESRARTPVKAESVPDTVMSNDSQPSGKGKVKEDPAAIETDGDVKMREHSPPLPTGPRGPLPAREPPKGPRGFVPPPTAPPSRPPPTQPSWNAAQSVPGSSFTLAPSPPNATEPPVPVSLPTIPIYKFKTALNPELETEIARVQAQRAQLTSEYTHISKAARRALHELEMASLDLRAAENRRRLADSHVEKARLGVLGIDYLPTAST